MAITLANLNRFSIFSLEDYVVNLQPHLACVATLHRETLGPTVRKTGDER